jgi:hypothetical protein
MFNNEEVDQIIETNPNMLAITRSHVSCDINVKIPEELYLQYRRGYIDRATFEEKIDQFVGDDDYTTYEINYFDKDDFSEMVEAFIEEMKIEPYLEAARAAREEAKEKSIRIAELEAELDMLKGG